MRRIAFRLAHLAFVLFLAWAVTVPLWGAEPGSTSLWVAHRDGALRLAASDGRVEVAIRGLSDVRGLAVDSARGTVWILSRQMLSLYDRQGERRLALGLQRSFGEECRLALDPRDGSVWLGEDKDLWSYSWSGQLLARRRADHSLEGLAMDPERDLLWVGFERSLEVRDGTSGALVRTLPVLSLGRLEDLAIEAPGRAALGMETALLRVDEVGSVQGRFPFLGLKEIAAGPLGTWAASEHELRLYGPAGQVASAWRPLRGDGGLRALAADPAQGHAWVASRSQLANVNAAGEVIRRLDLHLSGPIVALAVEADATSPSVEILAPVSGSYLNDSEPRLRLRATDGGSGVDWASLSARLDDAPLALTCQPPEGETVDCRPAARFGEGLHEVEVTLADRAGNRSLPASVRFTLDTVAPALFVSEPADGLLTRVASLRVAGSVSETAQIVVNGVAAALAADGRFEAVVLLTEGTQPIEVVATDRAGNGARLAVEVTLDTQAPAALEAGSLTVTPASAGRYRVRGAAGSTEVGAIVVVLNDRTGESAEATAAGDGSFVVELAARPGDRLVLVALDRAGNRSAETSLTVPGAADPDLPPDPATVAPPLDRTVPTDLHTATRFLYEGADPIQRGVAPGVIEPLRVAVLRGRVLGRDGSPLPKVRVTLLGHAELGHTFTRADGAFDLVVNGGEPLVVQFERPGYLTVQRSVHPPWRDYQPLEDVILLETDPQAAAISLGAPGLQVARSRIEEDADGPRQATVLFPAGLTAERVLSDGTTQPLANLTFRATEYTVGPDGPQAMPGALPAGVGYTYAVELSADEVGDGEVRFNTPVFLYVDNFLGFPVGTPVPAGSYLRREGRWQEERNGRVVKLLGTGPDGNAILAVDRSGGPAGELSLADLGVTAEELAALPSLFAAGESFWRVPIPHFSPWDLNWPLALPPDAEEPPADPDESDDPNDPNSPDDSPDPRDHRDPSDPSDPDPPNDPNDPRSQDASQDEDDPDNECGSILDCHNQILGEVVPLVGSGESLHYASDRVIGRNANYFLKVQLTGATVPARLKRVELEISLAGQVIRRTYPAEPKQVFTYLWDGLDAYGRPVQGKQPVTIRKAYVYPLGYSEPIEAERSWARFGVTSFAADINRFAAEVKIWRTRQGPIDGLARVLGGWDAREIGLGGWSLSSHHVYDPNGRTVYLGTGERRTARQLGPVALVAAGSGEHGSAGDGGRATLAQLAQPADVAVAPDGTAYIADTGNHVVRKISPGGVISRVAGVPGERCETPSGGGTGGLPCGADGPALAAHLYEPAGVAVGPAGDLFIADTRDNCVRRLVGTQLVTVAGHCSGFDPEGPTKAHAAAGFPQKDLSDCLAGCDARTELELSEPGDVAVAEDGTLYIADSRNDRIVAVSPAGWAWAVAGLGGSQLGDGGPALDAHLRFPSALALGRDGELFVSDSGQHRIRRIGRDGIITTVAGTGEAGYSGDGGPGAQAQIAGPARLAVGRDGSLYFVDSGNRRVRRVSASGLLSTLAGGEEALNPPGGATGALAQGVSLRLPLGLAAAPDGSLWLTDFDQVFRLATAVRGFSDEETLIPAEGGGSVYVFDASGRHLRTLSTGTGAILTRFGYDAAGRLDSITDVDGLVTRIERNAAGDPTALVAPFGQRTSLTVDAHGYLATVTNPQGETIQLTYGGGGLLESKTDPRGNVTAFAYDTQGRLVSESDPAGGRKTLSRYQSFDDFLVEVSTVEGRRTARSIENLAGGASSRVSFDSRFGGSRTDRSRNGFSRSLAPDGTVTTKTLSGDPVWGSLAPFASSSSVSTPSGLTSRTTVQQTADLLDLEDPLTVQARHTATRVNGRLYQSDYSAGTRRLDLVSPEGRRSYSLRDPSGRVTEVGRDGLLSLRIAYDPAGRPLSASQGAGADERTATFEYDGGGRLLRIADPAGRATSFTRDAVGRVLSQTLPDGRVLGFAYDPAGNVSAVVPPGRSGHAYTFTPVDLPAAYAPPLLPGMSTSSTVYSYDRDRRPVGLLRPDGRSVQLTWAPAGNLASIDFSAGRIAYAYSTTALDQVLSITAPEGVDLEFGYDGFLPVQERWSGPVAGIVEREYDNDFRLATLFVDGFAIPYEYDQDGRLTRAGNLTLQRDTASGFLTATLLGAVSTEIAYNAFGESTSMTASVSGTEVYATTYERDKLGRIARKVESIEGSTTTFDYQYDPAGRLTQVVKDGLPVSTLTYDENSNRTSRLTPQAATVATYDGQDRLVTYGDTTYGYTENGELRSKTQGSQTMSYDYDELGNLRHVVLPDGIEVDYLVDGRNRRVGKRVEGVLVQGFLYQGALAPVAELNGAGTVVAHFVYGSRPNVPDYVLKGGKAYRILSDHLGSPRLVVDSEEGTIVQRMDYDEWGTVTLDTNPGFQPFGFAGGLYDRQTGLVRFGARDYDPEVGRWTAKDPIGFGGGDLSLYGYVFADPVNAIDLDGRAVHNSCTCTVYVKPGDTRPRGQNAVPLPPGQTYSGSQDGIAVPNHRGEVYKNVDGVDLTVGPGGQIDVDSRPEFSLGWLSRLAGTLARGGWKDLDWLKGLHDQSPPDHGWDELFNAVRPLAPGTQLPTCR